MTEDHILIAFDIKPFVLLYVFLVMYVLHFILIIAFHILKSKRMKVFTINRVKMFYCFYS